MKKTIILQVLLFATVLFVNAQTQPFDRNKNSSLSETIIAPITNFPPCKCTNDSIKKYSRIFNCLPCREMEYITKWEVWGNEIVCADVFFCDFQSNISIHEPSVFHSFVAEVHKSLKLVKPEFTINFTPSNCNKEFEIFTFRKEGVLWYNPDYEDDYYKNFDRTAQSCFDMLILITGISTEEILTEALEKHIVEMTENWELDDYSPEYIRKINSKYNIEIPMPNDSSYVSWNSITNAIIETLQENDIDLKDFTLNEFVFLDSENNANDIISQSEFFKLNDLFYKWTGQITIDNIERAISPANRVTFDTKQIGIELSTNIIKHWDKKENNKSEPKQVLILVNLNEPVKYSNYKGIELNIRSICPAAYKISGTDILFSFSNAQINPLWHEYLDLFALRIAEATFQIPYKNCWIMAKGKDIVLNNYIISGSIEFQIDKQQQSKIYAVTNTGKGKMIEIPIDTLKKIFLSLGAITVDFEERGNSLIVKFTKYIADEK